MNIPPDEIDADIAPILEDCKKPADVQSYIARLATIIEHLVCCMAWDAQHTESGIRTLYSP